ncbi:MAG: DUF6064 family protein [Bacteroidales bacterium]|nr:DUF6064 family protein [Bacteroidales bacterium]
MSVPFTFDEFLAMLERFNTDWWPAHIFMYLLAAIVIYFAIRKTNYSGKAVTVILVFLWIWVGTVFNLLYFSKLYPMAYIFVVMFILEGIILAVAGLYLNRLTFRVRADLCGLIGGILIIYSLAGYPLIAHLTGREYPHLLLTGMMPCPTAIFTLGLLLWTEKPMPKIVPVIPVVYALTGFVPVRLGVVEDIGLILAGIVTGLLLVYRHRSSLQQ